LYSIFPRSCTYSKGSDTCFQWIVFDEQKDTINFIAISVK
jgi:hypothetical protein